MKTEILEESEALVNDALDKAAVILANRGIIVNGEKFELMSSVAGMLIDAETAKALEIKAQIIANNIK